MLRFSKWMVVTAALLGGCLACVGGARGQVWKQIGNFPGLNFRCAYFWDTAHGVVAGDDHIYYYNSGTWKESTYPEPTAVFRSLRLLDGKNLYAASGSTCVWESTDSGRSWEKTAAQLRNADDLYEDPAGNIVGLNLPGIGMMAGTSFAEISPSQCLLARDDSLRNLYSTDGGVTWNIATNGYGFSAGYCMVADPCVGAYTLTDGTKVELWKSMDGGKTWSMIHDFVESAVDVLDGGSDGVLYVQGVGNYGIFCSEDGGINFANIGGPHSYLQDHRMFAFGLEDRSLIVMDSGAVWLWDDSIFVPFTNRSRFLQVSPPPFAQVSLCDSLPISLTIGGASCIGPESVTITQVLQSNPELRFDSVRSKLGHTGMPVRAWFEFVPQDPGQKNFSIQIKGYYSGGIPFDTTISIVLSAKAATRLFATTLNGHEAACAPLRLPVVIHASNCGAWRIDSIGPGFPAIGYPEAFDSLLVPNTEDTIWFDFHLFESGSHSMTFALYLHSIEYNALYDTSLSITVLVGSDNAVPRVTAKTNLTLANCSGSFFPILLHALPCDSVEFTTCTISLPNVPKYSINLTFPRVLAADEWDTLLFYCPPQGLNGAYIVSAHLTGKYLGSNATFDTTVQLRVTFTSSAGALIASDASVTLDTTSICAEADTTITLTNLGCDSITVTGDATNWLPGWSASDPAFPFSLAPDSSFTVRVHFSPSGPAWSQQNVTYSFEEVGGNSETSSALILNVTAVAASARVALSDTALDLGTFARCNASGDTTVTLTNTGCDSLSITSASLSPGTGFALLAGGDTVLAPGQSEEFRIGFADSIAGSYASALHLTTIGAHGGAEVDTTIPLNATVVEGSKLATLSTNTIDFGTTSMCDELDSSVTITNTGCEADTITALAFANTSFSSPETEKMFIIPPDSQITFPIYTHADTIGHPTINIDTLQFTGNLDALLPPLILSRGLTYPGSFALGLASEDSAPVAQIVPVYILRKGTVPASANELDFALTYDDNLLGYVDAVQPDITASAPQSLPNGLSLRSFTMQPASDRDTIATLQFKSYLAKHEQTPITLSEQKFMAGGEASPPCVASLDTNALGTNFTLELACGDGEITKVLEGVPIQIISMQTNSGNLNFTLERGDVRYAVCSAQILNVLGTQESERTLSLQSVTHASMEVGTLPAGVYFLRVASGGYVITRRFVIVR